VSAIVEQSWRDSWPHTIWVAALNTELCVCCKF
jgi:hypothetical protein